MLFLQSYGLPRWPSGKESACNAGDLCSIPGLGRPPGGQHGNPRQYSCLENPHGQRGLCWKRVFAMTSAFSWQNCISLFPASFCIPRPNFPVTPGVSPLQYSCLENPLDGGAWKAAVHGVAEGWTRLSDFTLTFHFYALEKEMATHSSVLAWRIPGTGEPAGLPSLGSHRVGQD